MKRKNDSGIVLKKGESQLSTGRYRYRYYDDIGNAHDVYSWRLRPEDPLPEGKKPCLSLREIEADLKRQIETGLKAWDSAGLTVEKLVKEYMNNQRPYWKESTITIYEYQVKAHIIPRIGKKKVSKITPDDVESFYFELINEGMKAGSISGVDTILNSSFRTAVRKRIIATNPCTGILGAVKKKNGYQKEQRHALEEWEQTALLEFIKEYYPEKYIPCYVLAWTGLRIGELAGLTWADIDFEKELIHVRRSLGYTPINGKTQYIFNAPKTAAGFREVPMLKDVKKLLQSMKLPSKILKIGNPDRVTTEDVIFKASTGNPYSESMMASALKNIVSKYNKGHDKKLPTVTPHIFRHTFTCWLIENFSCGDNATMIDNLKYIQKILGHTDASTTLNVYSELRKDKLKEKHEILKQKAMIF